MLFPAALKRLLRDEAGWRAGGRREKDAASGVGVHTDGEPWDPGGDVLSVGIEGLLVTAGNSLFEGE